MLHNDKLRETSAWSLLKRKCCVICAIPILTMTHWALSATDDRSDAAAEARGSLGAAGPKVSYGLMHAHTFYSDGSGTPKEAYKMAREAGLDFFAVTEHNHAQAEDKAEDRVDGVLIATNHDLYDSDEELTIVRKPKGKPKQTVKSVSLMRAAKEESGPEFVALYGQEFSTISKGNHVNVIDFDEVITVSDGSFDDLYEMLDQKVAAGVRPPIVQFNHPDVQQDLFYKGKDAKTKKKMKNDYGIDNNDLGPQFADVVQASQPYVCLIEVLSGPATKKKKPANFQYTANEDDYYFYLKQGFHIGPSAGQDNHYPTWGKITDARIGVLCDELKKDQLLEAIRENRTFATEDKNLDVRFFVNDALMGSVLTLADDTPLAIRVAVSDANEPTADYDVTLYHGDVKAEHRDQANDWEAKDGVIEDKENVIHGNQSFTFGNHVASGGAEFFYVRVTQDDGDRAWSAPLWINHPRTRGGANLVWSAESASKLFHVASCSVAKNILAENKRNGSQPPDETWKPHSCVTNAGTGPGH